MAVEKAIASSSLAEDVDLESLAKATEGMVGSDIEAISRRASMLAIRDFINQSEKDFAKFKINARYFSEALETRGRTEHQS